VDELLFTRSNHKTWYESLRKEDNTHLEDKERIALFYLIAGNNDLYQKIAYIYEFKYHQIKDCLSNIKSGFFIWMCITYSIGI